MKNSIIILLSIALLVVCSWCLHDTTKERNEIAELRSKISELLLMKPELDSIAAYHHKQMQKEWIAEGK